MSPKSFVLSEMFCCLFQIKDNIIRSQFACTYKEEELPLSRVLDFPTTSQMPTCLHPAPKLKPTLDVVESIGPGVEESTAAGLIISFWVLYVVPSVYKEQHNLCCILWAVTSASSDASQLDQSPGTPSLLRPWTFPILYSGTGAYHQPLKSSPYYKIW